MPSVSGLFSQTAKQMVHSPLVSAKPVICVGMFSDTPDSSSLTFVPPKHLHQHYLQTCEKCKFTGTTLTLPNQKLLCALSRRPISPGNICLPVSENDHVSQPQQDYHFRSSSSLFFLSVRQSVPSTVVLTLCVLTFLEVEQTFHRGHQRPLENTIILL